jgi:hypothetical protein
MAHRVLAFLGMTAHYLSAARSPYTSVAHDPVCARCGHGESLHASGTAGCLLCDQRASAGLSSSYCNSYLADSLDRRRVTAPSFRGQHR